MAKTVTQARKNDRHFLQVVDPSPCPVKRIGMKYQHLHEHRNDYRNLVVRANCLLPKHVRDDRQIDRK